jgi:hypothetical protein
MVHAAHAMGKIHAQALKYLDLAKEADERIANAKDKSIFWGDFTAENGTA